MPLITGRCTNCGDDAVSYRPTVHPLYCMKPECRAMKFREKMRARNKDKVSKRATEHVTCAHCEETYTRRVRDGGRIEALPGYCRKVECQKAQRAMYYRWRRDGGEWEGGDRVIPTEPMVLLDEQPFYVHDAPMYGCPKCSFAQICRTRVKLGLVLACEKMDTRDLEKLNNHPQYEEAMRVMQLKPNMLF